MTIRSKNISHQHQFSESKVVEMIRSEKYNLCFHDTTHRHKLIKKVLKTFGSVSSSFTSRPIDVIRFSIIHCSYIFEFRKF